MSPNKAGLLTVVSVIGLLVLWVMGSLAWQGLKFAQQSGQAQMAQQASAPGTCITELNGYYHCAQDRITPSGANITLRQCARSEITTAFPICWSDQPVPAPPKLAPELEELPVSPWVQVSVAAPEYKSGMTLSFCKDGFRCGTGDGGFVKGPFCVVNQLPLQNFTNRPKVYLRNKYDALSEDDKTALEAFCQQGFPIFERVPLRNAYGEPLQGVPMCDRNQLLASDSTVSVSSPAQSAPAAAQSVPTSAQIASPALTDPIPASSTIQRPQSQYTFHISRTETLTSSPSQSDIKTAPHTVLLAKKNGEYCFVGLFKVGSDFWFDIYKGTRGSDMSTEYYSYAALQEQGIVNLYAGPDGYWVGENNQIGILDPMIAQACRSGVHIIAGTGNVTDLCKTQ